MRARLVILGSTLTALALARDAHAHHLEPVVLDTQDGIAFCSRWVTAHLLALDSNDGAILSRLSGLADGSCLIATGDPWVRFVMRNRTALDSAFRAVLHPANGVLHVCLDKAQFSKWCAANRLQAPRAWVAAEQTRPENLAPPFLIRPAETLHGAPNHGLPKAVEVTDDQELASWLARFAAAGCRALVSESLLGQRLTQYSVPFARANGELLSFVARKVRPDPGQCSVGTCVELAPHPDAEALGRRAAEALDYFGIGEAEVLYSEATGQSYLIEVNCRPWLQYPLAPASGHDFLGMLVDQRVRHRPQVKSGVRWVDLPSDLFGAFSSSVGVVRNGQLGVGAYVASLLKVNVFARLDVRDPRPAFYRPVKPASRLDVDVRAAGSRPR